VSVISTLDKDDLSAEFSAGDIAPETQSKRRGRQPYPRDAAGNIIRPDGSKVKPIGRPKGIADLESQLNSFVTLINTLVLAFKPDYALDQIESVALVKALAQQCQTSPAFRKYVEQILKGMGGVSLIGVLALIVARRVARAGVLPIPTGSPMSAQNIDDMCGALLMATTGTKPTITLNTQAD
jgi:hypothetical protein